jgi:hypothetical protein
MNNITELRKELSNLFMDLKDGKADVKQASEMNNCAGKIINSLKVELEYYSLIKEEPDIKFLKK